MAVELIITDAGLAEVLNNDRNGWGPTLVSEFGLGSGIWTPTHTATSLLAEFKRLDALAGGSISPTQLHVNANDTDNVSYDVYEIGLYLDSGTLFAVVSQPTPIISKAVDSSADIAATIKMLGQITPDMIVFGDTNFVWNPATETIEGLVKLASTSDVQNGTGTGVVTSSQTAGFARTGEYPVWYYDPAQKTGIYTAPHTGYERSFAVKASKPDGRSVGLAVMAGDEAGELSISVQDSPSSEWEEVYLFRSNNANDERYLQAGNSLSDVVSPVDARANLGLTYAAQVQAQDGVNNATSMTPLRTKQAIDAQRAYATTAQAQAGTDNATVMTPLRTKEAIDEQRAINVGLVAGRVNFQRVSGSGVSMAQQFGTGVTSTGTEIVTASVTFPQNFTASPNVMITPTSNSQEGVITQITTTSSGFTVTFKCDVAPTSGIQFNWSAIGTVAT